MKHASEHDLIPTALMEHLMRWRKIFG